MSIITFWNDDNEQSGQTLAAVATATTMAIDHNYKILLISTGYEDRTMKNCFLETTLKKRANIFGKRETTVENGIEGLARLITSNKIQPSIITDYTYVIFKDRLELLNGYVGSLEKSKEERYIDFKKASECFPELLKVANEYYDMVIVDLDRKTDEQIRKQILDLADLNIYISTQRLSSLKKYLSLKENGIIPSSPKYMIVLGKYHQESKYNKKNLTKYLSEKKEINVIPFNMLYFEASEETTVAELFLKLKTLKDSNDDNYVFISENEKLVNRIIERLQELKMRLR